MLILLTPQIPLPRLPSYNSASVALHHCRRHLGMDDPETLDESDDQVRASDDSEGSGLQPQALGTQDDG